MEWLVVALWGVTCYFFGVYMGSRIGRKKLNDLATNYTADRNHILQRLREVERKCTTST